MKVYDELRSAEGCETLIALTFNASLSWFERSIIAPLHLRGLRRCLVLADAKCLSVTLGSEVALLAGAGKSYVVEGVRVKGRFHPKLYLLVGDERAVLFVGSGNLSVGGLYRNAELFERWEVTLGDATVPPAFDAARNYVDQVLAAGLQPVPTHAVEALDAAFGAPPLQKPTGVELESRLLGSPGALLSQLAKPPASADRLRMLAPFFDDGGEAAVALAKHFRATSFEVLVDPAMSNLTRQARGKIQAAGGHFMRARLEDRPVHAKVLHARGKGWEVGLHGSANLSHAAWRGTNAELVVMKTGPAAAELGAVIDGVTGDALSAEDWTLLEQREAARAADPDDEGAEPLGPTAVSAWWLDAERVAFVLRDATAQVVAAELMIRDQSWRTTQLTMNGREVRAHFDLEPAAGTAVARLWSVDGEGPCVVVHDRLELRDRGRALERADVELRNHLSMDTRLPLDAADFLDFLGRMFEDRKKSVASSTDATSEPATPVAPSSQVEWRFLKDEDFHGRAVDTAVDADHLGAADSDSLDPTRLMLRLLFGDIDIPDADASEGEGVLDEEGSQVEMPHVARQARRAKRDAEEALRAAAARARAAYLEALQHAGAEGRSPARMLEDLQVLSVALYRSLRSGGLSTPGFLAEYTRVLRAFFGSANTPFCAALASVPEAERDGFWTRTPVLAASCLLVFNACLADLEVGQYDDAPPPSLDFPHVAPVLWLRHVLRHAPAGQLLLLEKQAPRIRRQGQLWLAAHWPHLENTCSFVSFSARQIESAARIDRLEVLLRPKRSTHAGRLDASKSDCVLGFGRGGHLAPGFVDDPEQVASLAWLYDGAFQAADPGENSRHDRLHKTTARQVLPLSVAYEAARGDSELLDATELLRRFAGG